MLSVSKRVRSFFNILAAASSIGLGGGCATSASPVKTGMSPASVPAWPPPCSLKREDAYFCEKSPIVPGIYDDLGRRRLKGHEKTLLRKIFGDAADAGLITLHFSSSRFKTGDGKSYVLANVLPSGNDIWFYGAGERSRDYSREKGDLYGTFLHEATHTLQIKGRLASSDTLKTHRDVYEYALQKNSCFTKAGMEQEAAMVGDYARAYLQSPPLPPQYAADKHAFSLLKKTVEGQFPLLKSFNAYD